MPRIETLTEGLSLFTNYFAVYELVIMAVGVVAVIIWVIAMWRRGGQYQGKMHRWLALAGIGIWCGAMCSCPTLQWITVWYRLILETLLCI